MLFKEDSHQQFTNVKLKKQNKEHCQELKINSHQIHNKRVHKLSSSKTKLFIILKKKIKFQNNRTH